MSFSQILCHIQLHVCNVAIELSAYIISLFFYCVTFVASYGVSASSASSALGQGSTSILGEEYILKEKGKLLIVQLPLSFLQIKSQLCLNFRT